MSLPIEQYIESLPIGPAPTRALESVESEDAPPIDPTNLPNGVVTGSNLISYADDIDPELRSVVALSLLAAQRAASTDRALLTPRQWIERHDSVLQNLQWLGGQGAVYDRQFNDVDVEVHEAIIPVLTAAFGGAAAAALILTTLQQLKDLDKKSPWITLFDRESQRFNVSEYQFTTVYKINNTVHMNMAATRFTAEYGRTQVLFFRITEVNAQFQLAQSTMVGVPEVLRPMNVLLQAKLETHTNNYIRSLDLG